MAIPTTTYSGQTQTTSSPVYTDHIQSLGTLAMGGARAVLSGLIMVGLDASFIKKVTDPFDLFGSSSRDLAENLKFHGQIHYLEENLALAKEYQEVNQKDFDFWNKTYSANMAFVKNEAMNRPFYTTSQYSSAIYGRLDYLASIGRGQSRASLHIDKEWLNTRRKIGRYNVGHGRRVDYKYAMAKLNSELEGWNLGFRYEDNRKMQMDEQRHKHQADILNLGLGAGIAVRRGLATSTEQLSEARSQKAGSLGALANGLSTYSGFTDARNRVEDRQKQRTLTREWANAGPGKDLAGPMPDQMFKSGMENDNG